MISPDDDKVTQLRASMFAILETETVAAVIDIFGRALRDQGFIDAAELIEDVATASRETPC